MVKFGSILVFTTLENWVIFGLLTPSLKVLQHGVAIAVEGGLAG